MARRWFIVILLLAVVVGLAALWASRRATGPALENWIGGELQRIVNQRIRPQLHFAALTYIYPRTVEVRGLTLEAADPRHPGATVRILEADDARIELHDLPQPGRPLDIEQVILTHPRLRLISAGRGRKGFAGFSHFIRHSAVATTTRTRRKASEFLHLRKVQVHDGAIIYDPRQAATRPLVLSGINTEMDITPVDDIAGMYALNLSAGRANSFDATLKGQVNIDTAVVSIDRFVMNLALDSKSAKRLPPEVQALLAKYQVTGAATVLVMGTWPLMNAKASDLSCSAHVTEAHVTIGKFAIPVSDLQMTLRVDSGRMMLNKLQADLLGGTLAAHGEVPLNGTASADFDVHVRDLNLQTTMEAAGTHAGTRYAGKLNARATVTFPRAGWRGHLSGNGQVKLRDATLPDIPLVGSLVRTLSEVGGLVGFDAAKDTADVTFTLRGDHAHLDALRATSAASAIRGYGDIYFNGRLDLYVNAGPLERLQGLFGPVGQAMGTLTDEVGRYHVTGKAGKPEVAVEVGPR